MCQHICMIYGLAVAGGGEKNGKEGIVVGILVGSTEGKFGSGGSVTLGIFGNDVVGKLGSGGSCVCVEPPPVGIGRDGRLFGMFGNVGCGSVGRGGKGGSVWRRLRAAMETWMLEENRTMNKTADKKQ
ncbi:peroxidase-like protein 2 [Pyrus ussuriensis x Pyrus communis]|uniref:Peroxidase-like protein 2 n=1 Tax=Pyrus ussuriensis x Pyrus communis TaxID=2448454 RepID=A0A5N5I6T8_9ROSA|nr:peroxidase-like protein 2 [Pyrus ussuriensis x Pyrus communis]KAB2634873.1 peroxidase-like protein 2 [Pyrus ussuriensis x Pyrus communis]